MDEGEKKINGNGVRKKLTRLKIRANGKEDDPGGGGEGGVHVKRRSCYSSICAYRYSLDYRSRERSGGGMIIKFSESGSED